MAHDIRVAVVAHNLPRFEPPVGDNGFDTPYSDRLGVSMSIEGTDTLASVYQRAIDELQPKAIAGADGWTETPLDVVRWVWFYEPHDANGIGEKAWEVAEDLIVVDADGTARWNLRADEITFEQLIRASEHGLLRGDPLRPYLVLLLPQGGEAFQTAWDATVLIWQIVSQLLTARELVRLVRGVRRASLQRKVHEGEDVLRRHRERWSQAGAGPSELLRMLERRPWPVDDVRMLLGFETPEDTQKILQLYGFAPDENGDYLPSADEEARMLHLIGQEAGQGGFDIGDPGADAAERLKALLATGQLPPRFHLESVEEDDLE